MSDRSPETVSPDAPGRDGEPSGAGRVDRPVDAAADTVTGSVVETVADDVTAAATDRAADDVVDPTTDGVVDVHRRWEELLTVALLGTDRRDPSTGDSPIDALVADCQRPSAAGRMLAQAAACVAVRRAAMEPAPPVPPLMPAEPDPRPPCPRRAVARWRHIVASWPVLEDEWLAAVLRNGWRIAPELVPALLLRHRRDHARLARVSIGAGPVAAWLATVDDQLDDRLAGALDAIDVEHGDLERGDPDAVDLDHPDLESAGVDGTDRTGRELPALPMPPELDALRATPPSVVAESLQAGLRSGAFGAPHRPVLVNLVARLSPSTLPAVVAALEAIDPAESGAPIAASLADLARTRRSMLAELARRA